MYGLDVVLKDAPVGPNVKVKSVNTIRMKGKRKVWRGRPGRRNDRKKAVITLEEGQMIDVTTGI